MAEKKAPGFILEKGQKAIIDELDNEEAGIIFKAIYEYETTKKEPNLNKVLRIVFKQFKVKLDFYDENYKEKCETNRKNIQEYWNKTKNTNEYERIQMNTMATNKSKENKSKVKKNKENKNMCESNTPPTLAEIISFCEENNMADFDTEYFYEHYEANGWIDGNGNIIKSWKAKIRKWYKDDLKNGKIKEKDPNENKKDEAGFTHKNGRRVI